MAAPAGGQDFRRAVQLGRLRGWLFPLVALALLLALVGWLAGGAGEGHQVVDRGQPADRGQLEARRGALVDEVVFTEQRDVGQVTGLIERGSHQVFAQGITRPGLFHRLRDSAATAHDLSYGTSVELTLNPSGPEFADGRLNPFAVPAMREALNWLVNRRHVAEEIYGGLAVPRYLPLSTAFPDYARLAETARELELRYAHNPARAREVIRHEMGRLGAELREGQWYYGGEPVQLTLLIRNDDERRRIGDYLGNLLEAEGFRVERLYRTAEEASRIWIAGDPSGGRWHIYTGAWVSTLIQRDQAENFSYYYTPRGRAEPLWQAYEPDPTFDDIADRLQRRDYRDWDERQALMRQALDLAMGDSARVWLVDQLNVWPRARDVNLAGDLAGGTSGSALWPYTLGYEGRLGGRVVIGTPEIITEPWNPIAGSNWIFDRMITRALSDPPVLPDPFTGLHHPQRLARAEVTVEAETPVNSTLDWVQVDTVETIRVPDGAWVDWDSGEQRFVTAAEAEPDGLTARTRVRLIYEPGYLERRFHDGTRASLADVVLPWILTFERADEDSPLFDVAHVPAYEAFRRHFRGWHIVSEDPLVIDVYSDQIFPDAETIVAARAPGTTPWHMLALGIMAEREGSLAFSSNKADRLRVDWLSLVSGPSLPVLRRQLERLQQTDHLPYAPTLAQYLTPDEAAARYQALADWYAARGHFYVGDGPFYLRGVHPVDGSVVLRRFTDFPDPADKWLQFAEPQIPELTLDGPVVVAHGESVAFELAVTFEGEPYPREAIQQVQFLLFDGDNRLAHRGEAEYRGEERWRVSVPAEVLQRLGRGANSLEIAVTTDRVALPAFASHAFATVPGGKPLAPPLEVSP
ncbi:ABC transporter substrate-binding protein [Alkalilimnicola ehrlichii MLHE-1]|uniref:Solute binding protein-like protein n=1 Tax=Alkalilimnicola ehrlichii (strain ATCC BAA-1101 / DSM 17681 / MLHE-1) TaxID=187272 RepID=Q0A6L5_ALKEH|nr:solute binding protein-like protein [Alkalilimnicola ehrlichii MLHE-1]